MSAAFATLYNIESLLDVLEIIESHGKPNAVSKAGARGLFQIMPSVAKRYGCRDCFNPSECRTAARAYLNDLMRFYAGDLPSVLAAWNWGPANLNRRGMAKAPMETRRFIKKVMACIEDPELEPKGPPKRKKCPIAKSVPLSRKVAKR
jgi:soluble lytic murein transglycosylase-like protein